MASGINFFTNAIDVTPGTTGSYVDVDVSASIPSGSVGVVLDVVDESDNTYSWAVRKNGSTDNRYLTIGARCHCYAMIGVDASRIFEAKIENTALKLYLVGYFDANCGFFDNGIDKSLTTTGSWVDIDVSGNGVPEGATAAIFQVTTTKSTRTFGLRKNGSTDAFLYTMAGAASLYAIIGLDGSRICEGNISGTEVDFYLVGYCKAPVTMKTNADDISLGTTGAFTDIDITTQTEALADGCIIQVVNPPTFYKGLIRKNGSTDDRSANSKIYGHIWALCGLDSGNILEGYIEHTGVDFKLLGYTKPAGADVTIEAVLVAVDSESAVPSMALDRILSSPLVAVDSLGLSPGLSLGIGLDSPLVAADAEALVATLSLGRTLDIPLTGIDADVLVASLSLGRKFWVPTTYALVQAYTPMIVIGTIGLIRLRILTRSKARMKVGTV